MRSPVGSLGADRLARVDEHGGLTFDGSAVAFEWWIGAEDRWHVAARETAVRQRRLEVAPAYETAMRIPSGDAIHRVYAIGGPGDPVIVEIENDSPVPVALALVVSGLRAGIGLDLGKTRIDLDRNLQLRASKAAAHAVAAANVEALLAAVARGAGAATTPGTVSAGAVVALLQPLAHRTRSRFAIMPDARHEPEVDLVAAPDADAVARGWVAMLRRGMQVVFADPGRQLATDRARVDLLLEAGLRRSGPDVFAALEDWGLDAEAVAVWGRLGWRDRRAARRRADVGAGAGCDAATLLRATRDAVVSERADGVIVVAPQSPGPGEPLEVHEAPTRSGSVSFAIRWHGDHPALLWDVQGAPGSLRMVSPSLDPSWSTSEPSGEVLLGAGAVNPAGA